MINLSPEARVFFATEPVDFRKGVHGLVGLIAHGLNGQPYSGDVFVFRSKRSDRLKVLMFDGSGMVLATKWLEEGRFAWPPVEAGVMRLTRTQFAMLFEGLNGWSRIEQRVVHRPTMVS
jgi:transposase